MIRRPSLLVLVIASLVRAGTTITVHADHPTTQVSPILYGIFFEEINRAGDGGLYAEMINNRSFEDDPARPVAWEEFSTGASKGSISLDTAHPLNDKNTHSLRLDIQSTGTGRYGIANRGFTNLAIRASAQYDVSFYARPDNQFTGPLMISIEQGPRILSSQLINTIKPGWNQYTTTLISSTPADNARLVISSHATGTVWLDMISLMPHFAFKHHPFRPDLARFLADLHPNFMRFPGGCWVEGDTLATSLHWKQSIGPIEQRRTQHNLWGYESTNGLGFHEYLQLCEDLNAQPLFVINCGMSHKQTVPMNEMAPLVQDVADALDYANAPADNPWGKRRAQAGHPAPFNLKLIEVGNENGGSDYNERYALFYDAIKEHDPSVRIIANLWNGIPKSRPIDILDEHYYHDAAFFIRNADRYDRYDRKGPKIYIGEYAVTQGCGNGNLAAAIGEAAFMTGIERNSDIVVMASYAPLFANVHYKSWNPDLINFDASRAFATPSYYVQEMFSRNKANVVLPADFSPSPPRSSIAPSLYAVAGRASNDIILKVVNVASDPQTANLNFPGLATLPSKASSLVLTGNPTDENSLDDPAKILPKLSEIPITQPFTHTFPPNSVTILRFTIHP